MDTSLSISGHGQYLLHLSSIVYTSLNNAFTLAVLGMQKRILASCPAGVPNTKKTTKIPSSQLGQWHYIVVHPTTTHTVWYSSILVINTVCGSLYTLYHYNLIQKNSSDLEDKEEETDKGEVDFSSFPIPTFIYLFALSLTGPTLFPYFRNCVLRYL